MQRPTKKKKKTTTQIHMKWIRIEKYIPLTFHNSKSLLISFLFLVHFGERFFIVYIELYKAATDGGRPVCVSLHAELHIVCVFCII